MNPWDLSCRSKLGEQPLYTNTTRNNNNIRHCGVTVAGAELRLGAESGSAANGSASLICLPHLPKVVVPPIKLVATNVHLAAHSTAIYGGLTQSSTTSSSIASSSCSSSSASSSLQTDSSSSSASSSQFTSPASTRSNSIEISEEIQLVQRVALFTNTNEHQASTAIGGLKQAIDQLHNNNESTIINTNTDISSSSSSTSTSNGNSSSDGSSSSSSSLLLQDRKARKKDQNRRAAYNYRRKKMEEKNRMREEEMRLVYSRVCLIGYVEELEGSIMYILNAKTRKILDKDGTSICFLCPVCLQSCDNILNLRSHLNEIHYENSDVSSNNSNNNNDTC